MENMNDKLPFCCPKCKCALTVKDRSAICPSSHLFDRSKWGYYNLLLSNASGSHGDNKEMILARRAFLAGGYYSPLASRLCELVLRHTAKGEIVLDAGCGEGYYTNEIELALHSRDGKSSVAAFDISKDAVREVGKKNPRISLAVAGSYNMPIEDGSVATLINTFSPLALSETHRALREGGVFIMAIPERDHLFELKAALYDTPYKNTVADSALEGFELIDSEHITYNMDLSSREDIEHLFKMTPYAYRTSESGRARISELSRLDCTADFRIFVYRKIRREMQ